MKVLRDDAAVGICKDLGIWGRLAEDIEDGFRGAVQIEYWTILFARDDMVAIQSSHADDILSLRNQLRNIFGDPYWISPFEQQHLVENVPQGFKVPVFIGRDPREQQCKHQQVSQWVTTARRNRKGSRASKWPSSSECHPIL